MMHRPPYVPKLHSSQILTSVSGRTYESHTGLASPEKKKPPKKPVRSLVSTKIRHDDKVPVFSGTGREERSSPFSVALLTETADGWREHDRFVFGQDGLYTRKERGRTCLFLAGVCT